MDQYLDQLVTEIHHYAPSLQQIQTVFIGGGTPSILSIPQTKRLLGLLQELGLLRHVREYTVEANPNDVTAELALTWAEYGVNRVSLGMQTTNPMLLKTLNRTHLQEHVVLAIDALRQAGITNINIDLIYGLPQQTIADIESDLIFLKACEVPHISAYQLILEEKTKLFFDLTKKRIQLPDEDDVYLFMNQLHEGFLAMGYHQYEVSNYAHLQKESEHNKAVWLAKEYLGVGMGAHSQVGTKRFSNHRTIKKYLDSVKEFGHGRFQEEPADLMTESVFLGLRLNQGISLSAWKARFQVDLLDHFPSLKAYLSNHFLVIEQDFLKTTRQGMLFLNQIERALSGQ